MTAFLYSRTRVKASSFQILPNYEKNMMILLIQQGQEQKGTKKKFNSRNNWSKSGVSCLLPAFARTVDQPFILFHSGFALSFSFFFFTWMPSGNFGVFTIVDGG